MNDLLEVFGIAYLVIAFAKFMLCVPTLPVAIGAMSRMRGAPRGTVLMTYVVAVPVLAVLAVLFGWIPVLYREGIRFFFVYSNFAAMRDCVRAYREAHAAEE